MSSAAVGPRDAVLACLLCVLLAPVRSASGEEPAAGAQQEPPTYSAWSLRTTGASEINRSVRVVGLALDVQPLRYLRLGVYADALLHTSFGAKVLVPVVSHSFSESFAVSLMPGLGVDQVNYQSGFDSERWLAIYPHVAVAANAWFSPRWGMEFQVGVGPAFLRSLESSSDPDQVYPRIQFGIGVARSGRE